MITPDTPVERAVGALGKRLAKNRNLRTVGDLLDFLPRRYLDPSRPSRFADLHLKDEVVIVGRVVEATKHPMRNRRGWRLGVALVDEEGRRLSLTFFARFPAFGSDLRPGVLVLAQGTVGTYRGDLQLVHPEYLVLDDGEGTATASAQRVSRYEGPVPVYSVIDKVPAAKITESLHVVLAGLDLPDAVPTPIRERRGLPPVAEAYRLVHLPTSEKQPWRGRHALKYQEAFVIQASLARRRMAYEGLPGIPRDGRAGGLADRFAAALPFELTEGQRSARTAIEADLGRSMPMNRLLQGEVGSGKTVLALLAMLRVVDSGAQAAILAPTEVLATQHHLAITRLLGPLAGAGTLDSDPDATDVVLLTGSTPAKERRDILARIEDNSAGIVIGTHALLQEGVDFAELGLVVVDEQHRFGVEQRDLLRAKALQPPHVLVMTATPIPRTVAMTVYGDMEVTTLRELPPGRSPIQTFVVPGEREAWVRRTWQRIAEEVGQGRQAYVVCSRIGPKPGADDTAEDLKPGDADLPTGASAGPGGPLEPGAEGLPSTYAAVGVHEALSGLDILTDAGIRVGLLHGRMSGEDKRATMDAFAAGEIDVLVSTTVIEVGVDVPNATVMLVLDADRFGISQLHQLRGRVGRGSLPGLCLLHTQRGPDAAPEEGPGDYDTRDPEPPKAMQRLDAVAGTSDGFELARVDLEQRREGDVLGSSQSGRRSGLRLLNLLRDEDLIVQAHEDAWEVVRADPELRDAPGLRDALDRLDEEHAKFLEKG